MSCSRTHDKRMCENANARMQTQMQNSTCPLHYVHIILSLDNRTLSDDMKSLPDFFALPPSLSRLLVSIKKKHPYTLSCVDDKAFTTDSRSYLKDTFASIAMDVKILPSDSDFNLPLIDVSGALFICWYGYDFPEIVPPFQEVGTVFIMVGVSINSICIIFCPLVLFPSMRWIILPSCCATWHLPVIFTNSGKLAQWIY